MQSLTLLRERASELGLHEDELEEWAPLLRPEFINAVLAALLRYEEAIAELSR